MGEITPEILIALSGVILIGIALQHHFKGAFCLGIIYGTVVWWFYVQKELPYIFSIPYLNMNIFSSAISSPAWNHIASMTCELDFLYILTLNGLMRSMSDLGNLTKPDGAIPGGRWLYLICGATTLIGGYLGATPVLISPESAAGIKAGAKTGLSTCVCGILFGLTTFFGPLFRSVPCAGTAPLLIMIGVLLFQNVLRIDWSQTRLAVPAFCCLFFVPFNLAHGVYISLIVYIIIGLFTGDFWKDAKSFLSSYSVYWCGATEPNDEKPSNCHGGHNDRRRFFEWVKENFDYYSKNDVEMKHVSPTTGTVRWGEVDETIHNNLSSPRCSRGSRINIINTSEYPVSTVEFPHHDDDDDLVDSDGFQHHTTTRTRSATEVLRGGDRFDINVPINPLSSLLFMETGVCGDKNYSVVKDLVYVSSNRTGLGDYLERTLVHEVGHPPDQNYQGMVTGERFIDEKERRRNGEDRIVNISEKGQGKDDNLTTINPIQKICIEEDV